MRAKVMVVDDDDELRDAVANVLADEGYEVVCAESGESALAALRAGERPQLILLDLMMPGMSGWQFRDAQREDARIRGIPVVVMTASRSLRQNPIEADDLLLKPVSLERLLEVVERIGLPAATF